MPNIKSPGGRDPAAGEGALVLCRETRAVTVTEVSCDYAMEINHPTESAKHPLLMTLAKLEIN